MALKAVAFDAFGTLVHIGQRRAPFRKLMRWAQEQGHAPQDGAAEVVMARALDLRAVATELGVMPPAELLEQWEHEIEEELSSIRLYPDSLDVVYRLQQSGYRVGLCSNLALPYGAPVRALLPMLDAYAMSYEAGAVKPQPRIYQFLLEQLGCEADEVLFVGDTAAADVEGPRACGMQAVLLKRASGQTLADVMPADMRVGG